MLRMAIAVSAALQLVQAGDPAVDAQIKAYTDSIMRCAAKAIPSLDDGISDAHTIAHGAGQACHSEIAAYTTWEGQRRGYGPWWGADLNKKIEDGDTFLGLVLRYRQAKAKPK